MLHSLAKFDRQAFLFLNGLHSPFLDQIMWLISEPLFWIPLYLWFIWILFRSYRKNFWLVLLTIIILITLSDQVCNLFKYSVMRIRPSNNPSLSSVVHLVNGYAGGTYGFFSAHASNSFAISTFIFLLVRNKPIYILPILLSYAVLVSYSRIYLGVHYPGDVIAGILNGILIGFACGKLFLFLEKKLSKTNQFSKTE